MNENIIVDKIEDDFLTITDSDFYKTNILGGVARYTNSIVLQPTAMSGLKPLLYSNPKTAILFQLLSYPAAFTNTVLKGAAKSLTKAPVRNGAKLIPAALIMTGMSRWTNYLRTNGESERGKDLDEVLYNSVARWGGNGLLLDSFNRAKTSAKYSGSALSYATLPFGPASSDALNLIQQGIIPTLGGKVPILSGTYMGKTLIGDKDVTHYRRSLRKAQEDIFGGLIPEFDKEVPAAGFVAGGLVKIGAKAITTTASDLMGNKLGTLGPKIASKKPVEFNDEVAENLSKATDNYFNEDTLNLTSARISEGLEELEMEGVLDFYNLSHLEFVDAMVHSEIKKDIKSIEELEKLPEWKKAIESTNEKEAITNWANAQKAMGYTKEHRKALRIIQQNKNKVDPEGTIEYMVPDMVRSLKQAYNKVKINVTPEEVAAAQKQKFDDPTFNNLHDFISSSARMRMDTLSEMGGDKIAENVLIKLAAEGDINFSTFKAPKIKVLKGVSEFKIAEIELSIPFTAKASKKDGKKVPKKPDITIHLIAFFDKFFKLLKPAINKINPVIIIRNEPNCIGLKPIKLFLMSMNELPQIRAKRNKKIHFLFSSIII